MRRIATVLLVLAGSAALHAPSEARWKDQYATANAEVRAWYQRQVTTPETRKRINATWYKFCCDDADTVNAKFQLKEDRWLYQLDGESEWRTIPQDVVQQDVQTPNSRPVLFVDATHLKAGPVCFFPGGSGT